MVFCCGSHHGWAADVDLFDGLGFGDAWFGDGGFEGIEIDDYEINGLDVVVGHGLDMLGEIASCEEPAVDVGVECFDASVHHFGEVGDLVDGDDGDACIFDGFGGASGGDDLDVEGVERSGEFNDAGFIGDREKRPRDLDEIGSGRDSRGVCRGCHWMCPLWVVVGWYGLLT